MTTRATELLEAVRGFLGDEVMPALEGRAAFEARIARNALGIVAREITLAPALVRLDADAGAWLGSGDEEAPVALAAALRTGECVPDGRVIDYLKRRTLLRLSIDNPRYSGYRLARERWPELASVDAGEGGS